jgi:enterochelin esterase-like enzyme
MKKLVLLAAVAVAAVAATPALPQGAPAFPSGNITAPPPPIPAGITVESVKVHGKSLEGNLEGDSPDREAMVVLPPSYKSHPNRRYPVVYYLHGFAIDGRNFYNFMHVPEAVDHSAKRGAEFIVVVPDTLTKLGGSMYSSSVTTGDFKAFVAKDLVAYIDSHYRTIASRKGRGLAGHSMGGYGTWTVGMAYPQVFNALYAQSACCGSPRVETVESAQKLSSVPIEQGVKADFGTRAALSSMVAWSPNPKNPPYFADPPFKDGKVDPLLLARLHANSPLVMLPQYVPALKALEAIRVEVGDKDFLIGDDTLMHEELDRFGVAHEWKVFEGDHGNRVHDRIRSELLPFFGAHLDK